MNMNVAAERRGLVAELRSKGKRGGDPAAQRYIGSPYPVLGLTTPQMRAILAAFVKAHRTMTVGELNGLAAILWKGLTTEEKGLAIGLLAHGRKILDDASWRLADSWIENAIGWGLSDSLASGPVAAMVYDEPARFNDVLRWAKAEDFWRRRASTYALHDFVLAKELDRPFRLLERLLYDEEFWVQRAVGTWLRECWKRDTPRTQAFLRKHVRGLPKVVITVATERAPKAFREELRRNRE